MIEIANLEATKQNLNRLNLDLEKDLQTLDEANEALLRKIQEKEKTIQRSGFETGMGRASPHLSALTLAQRRGGREVCFPDGKSQPVP